MTGGAPASAPAGRGRRLLAAQAAATVAFVVALVALGVVGYRATLQITGGTEELVTDPDAPGFVAEVKPSPVEFVQVATPDGRLLAGLLVFPAPGGSGGTVVPVPATYAAYVEGEFGPTDLGLLSIEAGLDEVPPRLAQSLTFGFSAAPVMSEEQFGQLAELAGPITVRNPDNVTVRDSNPFDIAAALTRSGEAKVYRAGTITLQPDEVLPFLAAADGPPSNQALRQGLVWEALLTALEGKDLSGLDQPAGGAPGGAPGELSALELVPPLVAGDVRIDALAVREIPAPDSVFKATIADPDELPDFVARNIAAPTSGVPGQRARVRLLNGTPDRALPATVVPDVVRAGGEVTQLGNAESFDVPTTRVEYVNPQARGIAESIAAALGVSATASELQTTNTDVVVVVGADRR